MTYAFGWPSHDPTADNNNVNPGDKCGSPCKNYCDCKTVVKAAITDTGDKIQDYDCDIACPTGTYKIALVVGPHNTPGKKPCDHHWYRQLPNGFWSHKRGNHGVHDPSVDASGKPIRDPRLADRDYSDDLGGTGPNYRDFCGCFCVPNKGIDIRK